MTHTEAVAPAQSSHRSRVVWAALAVLAAAAVWASATNPKGPHGPPLDPTSTSPNGAKALALLIGQNSAAVDTSGRLPEVGHGVVLVLEDRLDDPTRAALKGWVASGGTMVITDPASDLFPPDVLPERVAPGESVDSSGVSVVPGCDEPWVAGVSSIRVGADELLPPGPPAAERRCFDAPGGVFALEESVGRGVVVGLASPALWTNQNLGLEDNSLLAANLLVSSPGSTVAWLGVLGSQAGLLGSGHASLWSLVSSRVRECLVGLLIAAIALAAWRARRLGRPVTEDPVVPLPGSSLVRATGRLLARDRDTEHAASVIRADSAAALAADLGVSPATAPPVLAALIADRGVRDEAEVLALLTGPAPTDETALLALARSAHAIRLELTMTDAHVARRPVRR